MNILLILEVAKKAKRDIFIFDSLKIKDFVKKKKKDTMNKIKGQMTA